MPCPGNVPSKMIAAMPAVLLLLLLALAGCGHQAPPAAVADRARENPAAARTDNTAGSEALRTRQWLDAANTAFKAGRLTAPADDNALAYLLAVIERDPDNRGAFELLVDLTPIVAAAIEAQIAVGDLEQAQPSLALLARASPDSLIVQSLQQKLASAVQRGTARLTANNAAQPAADPLPDLPTPRPPPASSDVQTTPAVEPTQTSAAEPETAVAGVAATPRPAQPSAATAMVPAAVRDSLPPAAAATAVTQEPVAISKAAPQYPDAARKRRTEGWVDLQFVVNADGAVETIEVIDAEPSGVFERSAERAVQRWKFKPAERDGKPVPARVRTRVGFRLG